MARALKQATAVNIYLLSVHGEPSTRLESQHSCQPRGPSLPALSNKVILPRGGNQGGGVVEVKELEELGQRGEAPTPSTLVGEGDGTCRQRCAWRPKAQAPSTLDTHRKAGRPTILSQA